MDILKERLRGHEDDALFLNHWKRIKTNNKIRLMQFIKDELKFSVDDDLLDRETLSKTMVVAMTKHVHQHKRQLLSIFSIIDQYLQILDGTDSKPPKIMIYSGKSTPESCVDKRIIQLIFQVSRVINSDPKTKDKLKVYFLENFNVKLASNIIPAADISE